jgi:hypothetical protein
MSEKYEYLGFVYFHLLKQKMVPVKGKFFWLLVPVNDNVFGYWYQLMTLYLATGTS